MSRVDLEMVLDKLWHSNLGERVRWTFIEVFLSTLTAASVFDWDVNTLELALGSALGAAIVPVKEYAKRRRGEVGQ